MSLMAKRRDAIKMTEEEVQAFLRERHVMNVASFGPDGSIHLVAMWYGFIDGRPAFETYQKSQKVKNLERDPRVTVLVEAGEVYEELRGVEIVGTVTIHRDSEAVLSCARSVIDRYWNPESPEQAEVMAAGLAAKRVAVEIKPERVVSWDHRKIDGY